MPGPGGNRLHATHVAPSTNLEKHCKPGMGKWSGGCQGIRGGSRRPFLLRSFLTLYKAAVGSPGLLRNDIGAESEDGSVAGAFCTLGAHKPHRPATRFSCWCWRGRSRSGGCLTTGAGTRNRVWAWGGRLRDRREGPAVRRGLQPFRPAWEPCSWHRSAGLALLAREMLAGRGTPWGRDTPRDFSRGWPTWEQSRRKSSKRQRDAKHHHERERVALWDNTLEGRPRSNGSWCRKGKDKKDTSKYVSRIPMFSFILSKNIFFPQEWKLEGKGKKKYLMCMAMNEVPQSQKTKMGKIKLTSILVRFPFWKTPGSETLNAFNHICPIKQKWTT